MRSSFNPKRDLAEARRHAADIARAEASFELMQRGDVPTRKHLRGSLTRRWRSCSPRASVGSGRVSRRPARVTQAEIDRAIRAVLKAGATAYDVILEEDRVIVRPRNPQPSEKPVAETEEIVL